MQVRHLFLSFHMHTENKFYAFGGDYFRLINGRGEGRKNTPIVFTYTIKDERSAIVQAKKHCCQLQQIKNRSGLFSWGLYIKGAKDEHRDESQSYYTYVNFTKGVIHVACGEDFTACIIAGHEVYTWGGNYYGELGLGDNTFRGSPTKVTLMEGVRVKCISCTLHSTYTWDENSLFSWGSDPVDFNTEGEFNSSNIPTRKENKIFDVICGAKHSFFITHDGKVFGFGNNIHGQAGIGTGKYFVKTMSEVKSLNSHGTIYSIACGEKHSIAWTAKGVFSCGKKSKMGIAAEDVVKGKAVVFKEIPFFKDKMVTQIGCGKGHSFVLTTDGLYGFGKNKQGQLSFDLSISKVQAPKRLDFFDMDSFFIAIGRTTLDTYRYSRRMLFVLCREFVKDDPNNLFDEYYLPLDLFKPLMDF